MAEYELGYLYSTPVSYSANVNVNDKTDVFEFNIFDDRLINLYLHNVSTNAEYADANITLFEDSNGNGVLDGGDTELDHNYIDGDKTLDYLVTPGKYFAEVRRFQPNYLGGPSTVSYDLDLSAIISEGTLTSTPSSHSKFFSVAQPVETFRFWIDHNGPQIINLNLHNLSSSDAATLELYRDEGGDTGSLFSAFDDEDTLVASANASGSHDGLISYRGEPGYYFARVNGNIESYDWGNYELDLAAVHHPASKLLAGEAVVGDITNFTPNGQGNITDANTTDSYLFSLGDDEGVHLELKGMTGNANMRLIKDANNNRIVDPFEVMAYSIFGGTNNEYINNIEGSGDYFVEIYQDQAGISTPYVLDFERYSTGAVTDIKTLDDSPLRDTGTMGAFDPGLR